MRRLSPDAMQPMPDTLAQRDLRTLIRRGVFLILIAAAIGGTHRWISVRRDLGQTAATASARGAEPGGLALEASGTMEGTLVRVASKLPGKVTRVLALEGDRIAEGQLLIALEDREIQAQLSEARARLETASARYQEAVAGTRPEAIREAEAELRRAAAVREGAIDAVRNRERQWARSTELKQGVELAQSQVASAEATLQASIARLDRLKAGTRPEELREAEESVAAAQATAQRALEEEDRMRRAYEGGAVARRTWDMALTEREVAAANLQRARARLTDLRSGARPEEIREAEQQVIAARAVLEGARTSLINARQLYQDRLPEQQRLDAARSELRSATSAVAAARAHLDLLRRGTRVEVIRQLRAQEREARAALTLVETHRRDLEIRSPVTGVVTARSVEPGEVVTAGARLLELADIGRTWVRVYLPEKVYGRVRVGDRVSIAADSLPDQQFPGHVAAIAQEAEYTPRSVQTREERVNLMFAIKVDVDNRQGRLLIGMPVDVRFE